MIIETDGPESIELFIKDQAFSPSSREGGGIETLGSGKGAKSYDWSSINHSILSGMAQPSKIISYIILL